MHNICTHMVILRVRVSGICCSDMSPRVNWYFSNWYNTDLGVISSLRRVPAMKLSLGQGRGDKITPKLVLYQFTTEGTCRCNISPKHGPATFSCVCTCCDFVPATCPRYTSLLHVASVCTTQVFCCCNVSLQHEPPCLATLRSSCIPSKGARDWWNHTAVTKSLYSNSVLSYQASWWVGTLPLKNLKVKTFNKCFAQMRTPAAWLFTKNSVASCLQRTRNHRRGIRFRSRKWILATARIIGSLTTELHLFCPVPFNSQELTQAYHSRNWNRLCVEDWQGRQWVDLVAHRGLKMYKKSIKFVNLVRISELKNL